MGGNCHRWRVYCASPRETASLSQRSADNDPSVFVSSAFSQHTPTCLCIVCGHLHGRGEYLRPKAYKPKQLAPVSLRKHLPTPALDHAFPTKVVVGREKLQVFVRMRSLRRCYPLQMQLGGRGRGTGAHTAWIPSQNHRQLLRHVLELVQHMEANLHLFSLRGGRTSAQLGAGRGAES